MNNLKTIVKNVLCRVGQLRNNITIMLQKNDMVCIIKIVVQKKNKQKVCLHKNVNKNCIQILRLLEKEGFVNEKSPFNVYVVVTLFNNKIKAVKSLTRIYIRNILLKNIENISQMLDVVLWQNYFKKKKNSVKNVQEKIVLVIFSIFSFCTSILTEGKIQEEKTLPPFIREALLSECPARDVDAVNYPVIKGFFIIAKKGISAIGHGVLDLVGGCTNTIKTSNSFNFIDRLPLAIKDSIIQNNTNILSNISVKSLINISDMGLKTSSGFLNNALFFLHEHRSEGLYVTSVIACLFLAEYFDLCGAKNLKASKNKQILLDADSLRQECAEAQKKMFVFLQEIGPEVEAQLDLERARLLAEARVAIEQQEQLERERLLAKVQAQLDQQLEQILHAAANKAVIDKARADQVSEDKAVSDAARIARITAMVAQAQAKWAKDMPDGTPISASFICDSVDSGMLIMVKKECIDKMLATITPKATEEIVEKYSSFLERYSIADIIERVFRPVFEEIIVIQSQFDYYIFDEPSIMDGTKTVEVFIKDFFIESTVNRYAYIMPMIEKIICWNIDRLNEGNGVSVFLNERLVVDKDF